MIATRHELTGYELPVIILLGFYRVLEEVLQVGGL